MEDMMDIEKYDEWLERHFEDIVTKYPHKAIAVVGEEIVAVADNEKEADRTAREKYPDKIPFVVTVPSEEDLVCLLSVKDTSNIRV